MTLPFKKFFYQAIINPAFLLEQLQNIDTKQLPVSFKKQEIKSKEKGCPEMDTPFYQMNVIPPDYQLLEPWQAILEQVPLL
jgi:hypothetical protein